MNAYACGGGKKGGFKMMVLCHRVIMILTRPSRVIVSASEAFGCLENVIFFYAVYDREADLSLPDLKIRRKEAPLNQRMEIQYAKRSVRTDPERPGAMAAN